MNLNDYLKAINMFMKILKINNNDIDTIHKVYVDLGTCYKEINNIKMCIANYDKSLTLKPNNNISTTIGDLYYYMKEYELSIKYHKKCSDFEHNYKTQYNCSFPYLGMKKFKEGFNMYENRLKSENFCHILKKPKRIDIPQIEYWDGIKQCDNLLIIYEQGIGDNIQYYRFILELTELYPDMKISYFCKNVVSNMFKQHKNIYIIDKVIISKHNYKLYIMSLPYILGINEIKLNINNYINVNYDKIIYWKENLANLKKYRIGFTFKGLLTSIIEKNLPLNEFNNLFDDNFDFICLHKLNEINEEEKLRFKDNITFIDIDKDVPFEDTIAILHNIDLLITIDTYIVHLAGILNIKTWLLLGFYTDWRWFNDDKCLWYESVEILRMTENKPFKNILFDVKEKLEKIKNLIM